MGYDLLRLTPGARWICSRKARAGATAEGVRELTRDGVRTRRGRSPLAIGCEPVSAEHGPLFETRVVGRRRHAEAIGRPPPKGLAALVARRTLDRAETPRGRVALRGPSRRSSGRVNPGTGDRRARSLRRRARPSPSGDSVGTWAPPRSRLCGPSALHHQCP